MTNERRISNRVDPTPGSLRIFDRIVGDEIGTIANLSSTGFMLVASRIIDLDSVFQFQLVLQDSQETIDVGATCLWNTDPGPTNTNWAGFHIIDISSQAQQKLDQLVASFSSNQP